MFEVWRKSKGQIVVTPAVADQRLFTAHPVTRLSRVDGKQGETVDTVSFALEDS